MSHTFMCCRFYSMCAENNGSEKKNLHISSIENNYLFQWKMHSVIKVPVVRSDLISYMHLTQLTYMHICFLVYECITNTKYGHCKVKKKKSKAAIWNNGNDKTNLPTIIYCHFICIFNADITTFRILMSNVLLLTISRAIVHAKLIYR